MNSHRECGRMALVLMLFVAPLWAWAQATTITSLSQIGATGDYVIAADIDASDFNASIASFSGTLTAQAKPDGTFPVISKLKHPLFTTATGATISNIMLKDVEIDEAGCHVGAIACTANGATRIYNCGILPTTVVHNNKGEITGFNGSQLGADDTHHCGGLVGFLDGKARVINCFSYATIMSGKVVAGIVGYNNKETTQGNSSSNFNANVNTMVMNCMFYGDITGGTTKRPVYGGTKIANNAEHKVNNFNYFFVGGATYANYTSINDYNCSWQASEKYLNRFEFFRSVLNSNRRLCAWWVNGTYLKDSPCQTDAQVEAVGIAKWVLDPSIAPFPILKKWDKYPSIINPDSLQVYNPRLSRYIPRASANEWEGKNVGKIVVTINGGSGNRRASDTKYFTVTDMDTLNFDFCAKKIQLPYYNEIFGDPDGETWTEKYGNNYHNGKVVTGWKITSVTGGTAGNFKGYASPDGSYTPNTVSETAWEDGFNFADRYCTNKDVYSVSGRVFAQGGYYYVPEGVSAITIEAYWGNAVYLCNNSRCLDRVNNGGNNFYVSGQLPEYVGGETSQKVQTSLSDAMGKLTVQHTKSVYDQAIVLVGNYQQNDFHNNIMLKGSEYNSKAKPFTIMSADFDLDNEPDFCFEVGMKDGGRIYTQPIRFDFLPIPDITMAIRTDANYFGMRIFCPQGHFEITETAFMYTTQYEYDRRSANDYNKHEAPVILNGGEFMQIVSTESFTEATQNSTATVRVDRTSYFLLGGHLYMKAFTPGTHGNRRVGTRHCAVSVTGGEFPEFYLSGMFNSNFYNMTDNPHCYTNGGKFGIVAGAGMESVGGKNETDGGNVTFQIDRSLIREFYGGGINALRPVTGNIDVTCNNSIVHKYCGGPRMGDMSNTKTITNNATGTIFGNFYGGGNGGTNMLRERQWDSGGSASPPNQDYWNTTAKFNNFNPFTYASGKGYHAEFEFELLPMPKGDSKVVIRSYYYWASFSRTNVAPVTSTLTDCKVRHDFYGGGYLGSVGGDVTSTLQGNTIVYGSAYGGGYSASIPSFPVHDKATVHYAYADISSYIHDGWLDYRKYESNVGDHHARDTIYYQWIKDIPSDWGITGVNTSHPTFQYPANSGNWYCYTTESLNNLGAISGNATITIKDNTIVGTLREDGTLKPGTGNVFGGGNESAILRPQGTNDGNTFVYILGRAKVMGNIYGGGNMGTIGGDTKVIVNGESR